MGKAPLPPITAATAVLLARVLGTSATFWMNLRVAVERWNAERKLAATALRKVAPARKVPGRSGHHSTPPRPARKVRAAT